MEAGWEMKKMEAGSQFYNDYVRDEMNEGDKIGVDATQMSISGFELRTKTFSEKGKELVVVEG